MHWNTVFRALYLENSKECAVHFKSVNVVDRLFFYLTYVIAIVSTRIPNIIKSFFCQWAVNFTLLLTEICSRALRDSSRVEHFTEHSRPETGCNTMST